MSKEIYFLEGGPENDWDRPWELLSENDEYDCFQINNLYEDPKQLFLLEEKKPWGIFIGTTGIGHELERKELRRIFQTVDYIPQAIIFAGEDSAMTYLDIARSLKKHYGTKSYWIHFIDGQLIEYTWI